MKQYQQQQQQQAAAARTWPTQPVAATPGPAMPAEAHTLTMQGWSRLLDSSASASAAAAAVSAWPFAVKEQSMSLTATTPERHSPR